MDARKRDATALRVKSLSSPERVAIWCEGWAPVLVHSALWAKKAEYMMHTRIPWQSLEVECVERNFILVLELLYLEIWNIQDW